MKAWSSVGDRVAAKTKVQLLKHLASQQTKTQKAPRWSKPPEDRSVRSAVIEELLAEVEELSRLGHQDRQATVEALLRDVALSDGCPDIRETAREWVE
eukprot:2577760-Amphidinium_carterae.1